MAATAPSGGGPTPSPAQQPGPAHTPSTTGGHSTTNTPTNGQASTLGQVSPIVPVAAEAAGVAAVGFVGTPETPGGAITEAPELLSVRSVLEAAGGGEVQWAAGLFVTGGRQQLVVTTDRGRGWMPAQVLLPRDVVMPWRDRRSGAWEGLNDPMRVLLEWGAVQRSGEWIAISGTRASASEVLTKAPFTLADVGSDPRGVGRDQDRVSRGFFAVRPDLASAADEIEGDRAQREQGLWLAMDSLKRAGVGGTAAEICNSMFADRELLRPSRLDELPWESLERQHNVLSLEELRARRDVRDIPLGLLEEGPAATSREKLIQLYALESVLALNQVSPGQVLSDALYSWSVQQDASRAGKAVAV
ncbi:Uncharacterised protein [Mycobacteroides abscessus subsp. massiliense]|nr:Uncharacterised protein [Mycobacteroides abscessus subsp. massiliense]